MPPGPTISPGHAVGHNPLHQLLHICHSIAHESAETDAVTHEPSPTCMQSAPCFGAPNVKTHGPAHSATSWGGEAQLSQARVQSLRVAALHRDCGELHDAGCTGATLHTHGAAACTAMDQETVVRIKHVLHRMIDLILDHWYTPNKGETLQAMALRMCEDCVRDVFADGGAVCRKYAATIRETIHYELQQRRFAPSSSMHLACPSRTESVDSERLGSAPPSAPVQHGFARLSSSPEPGDKERVLHKFPRRKQKQHSEGQAARTRRRRVTISKIGLLKLFDLPLQKAASRLGLGTTAMKNACRELGISKWPYRESVRKSTQTVSPPPQASNCAKTNAFLPEAPWTSSSFTWCKVGRLSSNINATCGAVGQSEDRYSKSPVLCCTSQENLSAATTPRIVYSSPPGTWEKSHSPPALRWSSVSVAIPEVDEPSQSRLAIASLLN